MECDHLSRSYWIKKSNMSHSNKRTRRTNALAAPAPKVDASGVWIDTQKATIVTLGIRGANVKEVELDASAHRRILTSKNSGSRFGRHFINNEHGQQDKLDLEMARFVAGVVDAMPVRSEVVVFGPAHAKLELHKALKADPRWKEARIRKVAADRMTRNQKVAWVKLYFAK